MIKYDNDRQQRRTFYHLIMLVALSIAAGRIAVVSSKEGDTAFLSANDRSRWCTVASLVEDGTYAIDRQISLRTSKGHRPWYTIDMVQHRGRDGKLHHYSSKPPLLPTMVAGVYAVVHRATGMTMTSQPIYLPRIILALINLPMLGIFFWATISSIELIGEGEWARRVAATATCFATMLLPFAVTLNNHLPAAMSTAVVMFVFLSASDKLDDEYSGGVHAINRWIWFVGGIAAGFAAANELPALSMLVFWVLLIAMLDWKTTGSFLLGVCVVAAGFFATNYIAHDSLRPPYTHRGNGPPIASISGRELPGTALLASTLQQRQVITADSKLLVRPSGKLDRWVVQTTDEQLFSLQREKSEADPNGHWVIYQWDDWYDYPGSYWIDGNRKGVDLGEPSRLIYFFNLTIGYYGIFSLTPFWLLLPLGVVIGIANGSHRCRYFVLAVAFASVICVAFYVMRPTIDRNYGGVSTCFRWMLWFAPLWLVNCTPALDAIGPETKLRKPVLLLLAISVFSMATSLHSPWQSPWLYRFWSFLGWING